MFKFETDSGSRPSGTELNAGPVESHYRVIDALREDPTSGAATAVPEEARSELEDLALGFVRTTGEQESDSGTIIPS